MKPLTQKLVENKSKTMPILSFPSTQLLGITVKELLDSASAQAEGMVAIKDRCNIGVSLNMMDLSVEAEAFGAEVIFYDNDVPTIKSGVIDDIADVENIVVPTEFSFRAKTCIEGIKKAKEKIKDIPVFCGVIGPYSLAGRLFSMTELMMECYDSPDEVKVLLKKATAFIISYVKALKQAGADGVVLAEPAAGLLSPTLNAEFSIPFVKQIFSAVSDEQFIVCYHNCGDAVKDMVKDIATLGADIYHFGNAIELKSIIPLIPDDSIFMGNVDPVLFRYGAKADIAQAVRKVMDECGSYPNFMISSGCDIPAASKWENIDEYFKVIGDYYSSK